jgi:hypothetical protein
MRKEFDKVGRCAYKYLNADEMLFGMDPSMELLSNHLHYKIESAIHHEKEIMMKAVLGKRTSPQSQATRKAQAVGSPRVYCPLQSFVYIENDLLE